MASARGISDSTIGMLEHWRISTAPIKCQLPDSSYKRSRNLSRVRSIFLATDLKRSIDEYVTNLE